MRDEPNEDARRRAENLQAVLAGMRTPPPAPAAASLGPPLPAPHPAAVNGSDAPHSSARRTGSLIGTIGAVILFLLGKLKFLSVLAGVLKLKTFGTMLLSIGMYATEWGWTFATGFVLLIFVHELGHAIVLRREGIPAGAPVFIPFVGAFISMRGMPRNAFVEAKVGIGGPITGSIAAWATLGAGLAMHVPVLVALGHTGVLLNLFNLVPVSPLDGGRIAGAFSRRFWIVGYVIGVLALVVTRSPILLLVLLIGLWTMRQRLRYPVAGYDDIPSSQRLGMGLAYLTLVLALILTLPAGAAE